MAYQITALYVGILAIFAVVLAFGVIKHRARSELSIGHDNEAMHGAIRRFGNFTEYVPLALIVIIMVESTGAPAWAVHTLGAGLVAGRILHAIGLDAAKAATLPRFLGTVMTFLVLLAGGVWLIYSFTGG